MWNESKTLLFLICWSWCRSGFVQQNYIKKSVSKLSHNSSCMHNASGTIGFLVGQVVKKCMWPTEKKKLYSTSLYYMPLITDYLVKWIPQNVSYKSYNMTCYSANHSLPLLVKCLNWETMQSIQSVIAVAWQIREGFYLLCTHNDPLSCWQIRVEDCAFCLQKKKLFSGQIYISTLLTIIYCIKAAIQRDQNIFSS